MYLVKYRTASQVSEVSNSLAGCFMYFADPEDAFNTGMFCEKIVVWTDVDLFPESCYDSYGSRYRTATDWEIQEFAV